MLIIMIASLVIINAPPEPQAVPIDKQVADYFSTTRPTEAQEIAEAWAKRPNEERIKIGKLLLAKLTVEIAPITDTKDIEVQYRKLKRDIFTPGRRAAEALAIMLHLNDMPELNDDLALESIPKQVHYIIC